VYGTEAVSVSIKFYSFWLGTHTYFTPVRFPTKATVFSNTVLLLKDYRKVRKIPLAFAYWFL
jgi:hypothetical protein